MRRAWRSQRVFAVLAALFVVGTSGCISVWDARDLRMAHLADHDWEVPIEAALNEGSPVPSKAHLRLDTFVAGELWLFLPLQAEFEHDSGPVFRLDFDPSREVTRDDLWLALGPLVDATDMHQRFDGQFRSQLASGTSMAETHHGYIQPAFTTYHLEPREGAQAERVDTTTETHYIAFLFYTTVPGALRLDMSFGDSVGLSITPSGNVPTTHNIERLDLRRGTPVNERFTLTSNSTSFYSIGDDGNGPFKASVQWFGHEQPYVYKHDGERTGHGSTNLPGGAGFVDAPAGMHRFDYVYEAGPKTLEVTLGRFTSTWGQWLWQEHGYQSHTQFNEPSATWRKVMG